MHTGVCCDSRLVRRGDLFAAIPGTKDDGLKYVDEAVRRGAVLILAEKPIACGVQVRVVPDVRAALAEAAADFYGHPGQKLKIFAVTGTNGKTTTAWIVAEFLRAAGIQTGLITTVRTEYPGYTEESERTTPDAVTLQRLLSEMVKAGCSAVVMEASSHAIDQKRTDAIPFYGCGFTNLTRDHLDYHLTMENYFAAKRRLFAENPQAVTAVKVDDPYGRRLIEEFGCSPYRAGEVEFLSDGMQFNFRGKPIVTRLCGRYNAENILCAAELVRNLVPEETIRNVIENLHPRWGRLERVDTRSPATVFVDYAHTDDALANVLRAVREMTPRRVILVFGCGGDRDRGKRPKMAKAAASGADLIFATSDNPRTEDPAAILREIESGFPSRTDYRIVEDRRIAIETALSSAESDDIVLIAGKGHEPYQEINGVKHSFDDRIVAASWKPA